MIKESFSVGANPDIDIRISSGRIEVKTGAPGTVHVEIETTDPSVKVEQRGDQIQVSSEKNSGFVSRGSSSVVVATPDGSDLAVGTAAANVECTAKLRDVEIKTASGDVEIEEAESINIKTASGDSRIRVARGDVKVSSASGDVRLGEAKGKINFSSASGDLVVENGSGSLNASTASGDVEVKRFSGRRANLKSMSGSGDFGIPSGTKLELDATLLSGNLDIVPSKRDGRLSSGLQVSMKAKIVSGDLTVRGI